MELRLVQNQEKYDLGPFRRQVAPRSAPGAFRAEAGGDLQSLFASSGAFELALFFLKPRQGRKGSIFGAPRASQNRSKINKNEGRGKT